MARHTFKKEERLTNKKTFDLLFDKGNSFNVFPLKLVYLSPNPSPQREGGKRQGLSPPVELGISVPKRSFAKAVDRNTLKRRIREAYRKNKHILYEFLEKRNLSKKEPCVTFGTIALMIIYIAREELPYQEIEKKMIVSLRNLIDRL